MWSNSRKGLGESERQELVFPSEGTHGLDQKSMAKSYSLTLNLHPLPAWMGSELLQSSSRLFGKTFRLSTSPAPLTGGPYWECKLVTGHQRGFVVQEIVLTTGTFWVGQRRKCKARGKGAKCLVEIINL